MSRGDPGCGGVHHGIETGLRGSDLSRRACSYDSRRSNRAEVSTMP
jgi:hypothetical protein